MKLTNLQSLNLSYNYINEIPKEIGNLTNLQLLHLSNNQINEIPKEIGNLTNLQSLDLSRNQITEIPKKIGKLTNLKQLDLSGNPIKLFPKGFEITNFKLFGNLKLSCLSDKINIIIGKNGTGKTSLLQALTFGLIYEYNSDIDTRTLKRYIKKDNKKAVVKVVFFGDVVSEIIINHKLENKKLIETPNIVLSYGTNLFHQKNIFDLEIVDDLISGNSDGYRVFSIFPDYESKGFTNKFIDPTQTLLQLERFTTDNSEVSEVFDILLYKLNNFLSIPEVEKFKIVRGIGGYIYQNNKTKENFYLHELSEGYRSNILLVSDILIKILSIRKMFSGSVVDIFDNVSGTILIDDFDKYLHPTWQYLFLSKLTEVLPNIQFFVTTHNAIALQSGEGKTAIKLQKNEIGETVAEVKKIKYGNSLEVINDYYFDNGIYGTKTFKYINYLNKLKMSVLRNKQKSDFYNFKQKAEMIKQKNISGDFSAIIDYDISYLQNFINKINNNVKNQ